MTQKFRGRVAAFAAAPQFIRDHKAELLIQDTQRHDSGIYVCRVEVLGTGIGTGNGTRLLVEEGEGVGEPKLQSSQKLESCPQLGVPDLLLLPRLAAEPPQQASDTEQAAHTSILVRAGFYTLSFLSVAMGTTVYYQGKCELLNRGGDGRDIPRRELQACNSEQPLLLLPRPSSHGKTRPLLPQRLRGVCKRQWSSALRRPAIKPHSAPPSCFLHSPVVTHTSSPSHQD